MRFTEFEKALDAASGTGFHAHRNLSNLPLLFIDNIMSKFIIYGAQGIALGAFRAIKYLFYDVDIICFMITKKGSDPEEVYNVPVRELDDMSSSLSDTEKASVRVLICTPENVMDEINEGLRLHGFLNIKRMDSMSWAHLMEKAFFHDDFTSEGAFCPLSILLENVSVPPVHVYMTKFWKDYKVRTEYSFPDYYIPIQVGAALTDKRVADITDDTGDNISLLNVNYSELTGLYWVWKNVLPLEKDKENVWYGLAHYRRFLNISDEDLKRLDKSTVDTILPFPMPYEPDIEAHHRRYLSADDWDAVICALKEVAPEYASAAPRILKTHWLYNYNIFISRGKIFDDYCNFLFPVLMRVNELRNPDGRRADRYIGYIAETLNTIYHIYNRNRLRIYHAGCRFLV